MKITGEKWVHADLCIKKEIRHKNVIKQTVRREIRRHLVLECGHTVPATNFKKEPTIRTDCPVCEGRP